MAISETLRLLVQSNANTSGLEQIGQGMKDLRSTLTDVAAGYYLLKEAGQTAWEYLARGAQVQVTTESFQRLAREAGVSGATIRREMSAAAVGTITAQQQMIAANRLLAAGMDISAQEIGDLMLIARDRAMAMGIGVEKAFDDIILGVTRSSPLILDNLGIIVKQGEANERLAASLGKSTDELTANERAQALLTQVLEDNAEGVQRLRGEVDNTQQGMAGLTASWQDFQDTTSSLLADSPALLAFFGDLATNLEYAAVGARGVAAMLDAYRNAAIANDNNPGDLVLNSVAAMDAYEDAARRFAEISGEADPLGIGEDFLQLGRDLSYSGEDLKGFTGRWNELLSQLGEGEAKTQLSELAEAVRTGAISQRVFSEAVEDVIFGLGPMTTASEEAAAAAREVNEETQRGANILGNYAGSIDDVYKSTQRYKEEMQDLKAEIAQATLNNQRDVEQESLRHQQRLNSIAQQGTFKRADIQTKAGDRDYDLNLKYDDRFEDALANSSVRRLDIEEDYQTDLRRIRSRGSEDETEAIRNRDARALDKARATRTREFTEAQQDRDKDLRSLARTESLKIQQLNRSKQRELRDAQTWRERQLRDQQTAEQRSVLLQNQAHQSALTALQSALAQRLQETNRYLSSIEQRYANHAQAVQNYVNAANRIAANRMGYTLNYGFQYNNPTTNASGQGRTIGNGRTRWAVR